VELEPFGVQVMNVCPGGIVSKICMHTFAKVAHTLSLLLITADNGSRGIEKYKTGLWGAVYESGILKRANAAQSLGTPTAVFAAGVVKEALKGRMRFEYWAGNGARLFRILGHLPTWITAWLFRRRWGLDALAKIVKGK
jgi:hypothetical protein